MIEFGILNRHIAAILSEQGHGDLLMVSDAGFAIPKEVEVVDISLSENVPGVVDVLRELKKFFSVEKIIMSRESREINPTHYEQVSGIFGDHVQVDLVEHQRLKEMSHKVKAVIRTGDFTAYGNVILVSGAGDRWIFENSKH
jgi:D-ribose pyranase